MDEKCRVDTDEGAVAAVDGKLTDPGALLAGAAETLDFRQPVAVLLPSTLPFIPRTARVAAILSTLVAALPRGSYLALCHVASDLDPANVEKEKAILTEQAAESGKPPNVVEKMVEGRIRKWMEEVVLLKQAYVKNPDQTIEQLVAETAKAVGAPITVVGFARLALGEGVEKKEDDFAAEVAAMTKPT